MGFHNVLLDKRYSFGATGGPKFKTGIFPRSSGHEKRNQDWSKQRGEWTISYIGKEQQDFDSLKSHFYGRRGKAYGFPFWDAQDFEMDRQSIGTTNGVVSQFQIYKRYTDDGGYIYDRELYKIVDDTFRVWVNNVELSEGPGAGQFQININTGVITLGNDAGNIGDSPAAAHTIEVSCEFYVAVRYDTDHFAATIIDGDPDDRIYSVSLPIVEIRDYQ